MTYSFTCYSDASSNSKCSVIRFENVTILLDPSWNGNLKFYKESLEFWSGLIAQVDIVLLSQPTSDCLGAYASLYYNFLGHFQSRIAVYATLPVSNLGRVATLDLYTSEGVIGAVDSNVMDMGDLEQAFDHIVTIKHSQIVDLKSKFEGLTLIAYNSGYAPGGAIFCITTYSEKVIYAPRWNHTKDTILNGASILDSTGKPTSSLMRPSAVITTTTLIGSSLPYKKRASRFKELLRNIISKNGTAVIPTEIGGKFLDLFVLVHDMIFEQRRQRVQNDFPILLISYAKGRTLTYARSMLEWLSSTVVKTWEGRNNRSPFDIGSRLKIISPDELSNYTGSKICFVSKVETLINEVLVKIGHLEKTTVLLTEPCEKEGSPDDIVSAMYLKWMKFNKKGENNAFDLKPIMFSETLSLKMFNLQTLTDDALNSYKNEIEIRRSDRLELIAKLTKDASIKDGLTGPNGIIDTLNGEEDEDEDDDVKDILSSANRNGKSSALQPIEIPIDTKVQSNAPPRFKMFPFQPGKIKRDDYGDVVDFTQFIPIDQLETAEKRPIGDAVDEEDDPYELEGPKKNSKKRRRDDGGNATKQENFDDVSYLDSLNKPSHRTESSCKVNFRCSVAYIDLSSLVDQRSMTVIWPSLKPRKILLLAPPDTQNEKAVAALEKKNMEIVNLEYNKTAAFDTTIKSLDISIDPDLEQHLKWQSISDGYTVAHVVGRLVKDSIQSADSIQHREKLVLKPISNTTRIHPKSSFSIGDVKLAELKRKLTQRSHVAEFKGEGALVVDGQVAVRKISDGETVIDGSPSDLFYQVKNAVAEMLAKV